MRNGNEPNIIHEEGTEPSEVILSSKLKIMNKLTFFIPFYTIIRVLMRKKVYHEYFILQGVYDWLALYFLSKIYLLCGGYILLVLQYFGCLYFL